MDIMLIFINLVSLFDDTVRFRISGLLKKRLYEEVMDRND